MVEAIARREQLPLLGIAGESKASRNGREVSRCPRKTRIRTACVVDGRDEVRRSPMRRRATSIIPNTGGRGPMQPPQVADHPRPPGCFDREENDASGRWLVVWPSDPDGTKTSGRFHPRSRRLCPNRRTAWPNRWPKAGCGRLSLLPCEPALESFHPVSKNGRGRGRLGKRGKMECWWGWEIPRNLIGPD
jgi:hypothetical protein